MKPPSRRAVSHRSSHFSTASIASRQGCAHAAARPRDPRRRRPAQLGRLQSSRLLGLSVEPSIHGEKTYVAFLVQGGLGLPDRDDYLSTEPRCRRCAPATSTISVACSHSPDSIARTSAPTRDGARNRDRAEPGDARGSANDHNADNVWTRADFARQAPGMDWTAFFAAAGLGAGILRRLAADGRHGRRRAGRVAATRGVEGLSALSPLDATPTCCRASSPRRRWRCRPRRVGATRSRAQRAPDATQLAMGDAIGRLYVERYFPPSRRPRTSHRRQRRRRVPPRVEAATWMSPATKTQALAKLKALYVGVGYPEHWQDYSISPSIRRTPLATCGVSPTGITSSTGATGPARRADRVADRAAGGRRGARLPAERVRLRGRAAAAAQVRPRGVDAASYGAIGAIIGHDISHFVDVLGAEYDVDGAMRHWWTPDERSARRAGRAAGVSSPPTTLSRCDVDGTRRRTCRSRRPRRRLRRLPPHAVGRRASDRLGAAARPRVLPCVRAELAPRKSGTAQCVLSLRATTRRKTIASPCCCSTSSYCCCGRGLLAGAAAAADRRGHSQRKRKADVPSRRGGGRARGTRKGFHRDGDRLGRVLRRRLSSMAHAPAAALCLQIMAVRPVLNFTYERRRQSSERRNAPSSARTCSAAAKAACASRLSSACARSPC